MGITSQVRLYILNKKMLNVSNFSKLYNCLSKTYQKFENVDIEVCINNLWFIKFVVK